MLLPSFDVLDLLEQTLIFDANTGLLRYRVFHRSYRPGDIAGAVTEAGYLRVSLAGHNFQAHHVCWFLHTGEWPASHLEIDHKNRVRSDNRIENLRMVDRPTNQANRGLFKTNASGFTGVYQRAGRWVAQIGFQGKKLHLGTFTTLEEAAGIRAAVSEAIGKL